MAEKNTEVVNVLQIYESQINKSSLGEQITRKIRMYHNSSDSDKEKLFAELAGYATTMEEGIKLGYTGMTKLYDDKCDVDDKFNELKVEHENLLSFLAEKSKSNPKLLEEFNKLKNTNVVVQKTKRSYRDMVDQYILGAKQLK